MSRRPHGFLWGKSFNKEPVKRSAKKRNNRIERHDDCIFDSFWQGYLYTQIIQINSYHRRSCNSSLHPNLSQRPHIRWKLGRINISFLLFRANFQLPSFWEYPSTSSTLRGTDKSPPWEQKKHHSSSKCQTGGLFLGSEKGFCSPDYDECQTKHQPKTRWHKQKLIVLFQPILRDM